MADIFWWDLNQIILFEIEFNQVWHVSKFVRNTRQAPFAGVSFQAILGCQQIAKVRELWNRVRQFCEPVLTERHLPQVAQITQNLRDHRELVVLQLQLGDGGEYRKAGMDDTPGNMDRVSGRLSVDNKTNVSKQRT